jgi:hypothetical protein
VLAPTLRHGDIVIMDRLGSHKVAGVRDAIEGAGARFLCQPPYGPNLTWPQRKQDSTDGIAVIP